MKEGTNPTNTEFPHKTERANNSKTGLLLMVLLLLLFLLTYFLPKDPLIAAKIATLFHPAPTKPTVYIKSLTRNDPPLNFILAQSGLGAQLRATTKPSKGGYLLVFIGDCAGCITANLRAWEKRSETYDLRMILVTTASFSEAKQFQTQLGLVSPVFFDHGRTLEKQLNATWIGRCYFFDANWRLRWLEDELHVNFDPFKDVQLMGFLHAVGKQ
jgi:hypothetical protein